MLNKPVAGERLTAVFSCFVSCHNEILQTVGRKDDIKILRQLLKPRVGKHCIFIERNLF